MGVEVPMSNLLAGKLLRLSRFPREVKAAIQTAKDDGELVDVLGTVNSVERMIADERKLAASELERGTAGAAYAMEQPRRGTRSYNTTSLLVKFMEARKMGMLDTIVWLMKEDILRVSWQWKKLDAASDRYDVDLTIAKHEITDGNTEGIDVGVMWSWGTPKYVSIAPDLED